jgi:hypothetical protein
MIVLLSEIIVKYFSLHLQKGNWLLLMSFFQKQNQHKQTNEVTVANKNE